MQQDPFPVGDGGDGATELLPLLNLAFGIEEQIERSAVGRLFKSGPSHSFKRLTGRVL